MKIKPDIIARYAKVLTLAADQRAPAGERDSAKAAAARMRKKFPGLASAHTRSEKDTAVQAAVESFLKERFGGVPKPPDPPDPEASLAAQIIAKASLWGYKRTMKAVNDMVRDGLETVENAMSARDIEIDDLLEEIVTGDVLSMKQAHKTTKAGETVFIGLAIPVSTFDALMEDVEWGEDELAALGALVLAAFEEAELSDDDDAG